MEEIAREYELLKAKYQILKRDYRETLKDAMLVVDELDEARGKLKRLEELYIKLGGQDETS